MESTTPEKPTAEAYSIEELHSMDWEDVQKIDVVRLRATPGVDIAHLIEHYDTDEQRHVLRLISGELAAEVISEFRPEESAELLGEMGQERAVQIVGHFDPDDGSGERSQRSYFILEGLPAEV